MKFQERPFLRQFLSGCSQDIRHAPIFDRRRSSCLRWTAVAQDASPDALKDLAPTGKLRAAINLGNGVLAQKDPASSEPKGITPDSAELAKRLGVPLEMVVFESAGKVFDGAKTGAWDVAFIAIEPVRAAEIEFTAPYVIIEGRLTWSR